jgi:hypothetical protein
MHNGEQLGAGVGAGRAGQTDQLVGGSGDAQALGQGGGQQQPGVSDCMGVVEGDLELVKAWGGVGCWHRKGGLPAGSDGCVSSTILPGQEALFTPQSHHTSYPIGGSRFSSAGRKGSLPLEARAPTRSVGGALERGRRVRSRP